MKHFGKQLQLVVSKSPETVEKIAERAGTTRRNIYKIYDKQNIDIGLAIRLSNALQYDFLSHYVMPETASTLIKSAFTPKF